MKMYDPPSGWRYGFPKPDNPLPGESLGETLMRDGYPRSELKPDGSPYWCRFWDSDESKS